MAKILEAMMLILFGASWPAQIIKTLKVKNPAGKSFAFLYIIIAGYLCGLISKMLTPGWQSNWVIYIYLLDIAMVATDLVLSYYFLARLRRAEKQN